MVGDTALVVTRATLVCAGDGVGLFRVVGMFGFKEVCIGETIFAGVDVGGVLFNSDLDGLHEAKPINNPIKQRPIMWNINFCVFM